MNRKRKKRQRIRTSYLWAGLMSICALVALFAAVWVVMTVYETIAGDSAQWAAETSSGETSQLDIEEGPVSGWIEEEEGTRYLSSDGEYLMDQWIAAGDKLYYLDEDGYMATGDCSLSGQIFTFDQDGVLTDIQLDETWTGLTGDDNLQNLDSLVKSNAFWCYLGEGDSEIFKPIYYRKTTETEPKVLGGEENPEISTHHSLQIHDGYIYYLPQVKSSQFAGLSQEERALCNQLYRMKPGSTEKELLAEEATGFLVLDDGSVYYASGGQIYKAGSGTVYETGEDAYRVQIQDGSCYLMDAMGNPVSGNEEGQQIIGDRSYDLDSDGRIKGVYPAERTYRGTSFTLESDASGNTALYRQEAGGIKEIIARSDYGINSFCIADGMIYYSAYTHRESDGSRYSAVFTVSPDGSGNRQISQYFQGNILNLYYYAEKGKIYGEYTPVSWKNCYGQIAVIDLDGTVKAVDDSALRGSGVLENNDLLTLVMVEGNTITTYLRSCSYNRNSGQWTVVSEKAYAFADTLQKEVAASAASGIVNLPEEESSEAEGQQEESTAAETEPVQTRPAVPAQTNPAPVQTRPAQEQTSPAPVQTAPPQSEETSSAGPGYTEGNSPLAGPGGENIPIIEANPESNDTSGPVQFIGPGYQ